MKIILSRKGFDSGNAKMPSPIMPDGTLLSLPIPSVGDSERFSKLKYGKKTYNEIIHELKSDISIDSHCHLDPDIRKEVREREKGWRALFGQANGALSHLSDFGVDKGDLFLFFGWFKEVYQDKGGKYRFKKGAPNLHVLFGYLQIADFFEVENKIDVSKLSKWMLYHSHAQKDHIGKNNRIYVARTNLSFAPYLPGGGCFSFHDELVLTKNGQSRSRWDLKDFFGKVEISGCGKDPWKKNYFQSPARGQEFVIKDNKEVEKWSKNIIKLGTKVN